MIARVRPLAAGRPSPRLLSAAAQALLAERVQSAHFHFSLLSVRFPVLVCWLLRNHNLLYNSCRSSFLVVCTAIATTSSSNTRSVDDASANWSDPVWSHSHSSSSGKCLKTAELLHRLIYFGYSCFCGDHTDGHCHRRVWFFFEFSPFRLFMVCLFNLVTRSRPMSLISIKTRQMSINIKIILIFHIPNHHTFNYIVYIEYWSCMGRSSNIPYTRREKRKKGVLLYLWPLMIQLSSFSSNSGHKFPWIFMSDYICVLFFLINYILCVISSHLDTCRWTNLLFLWGQT